MKNKRNIIIVITIVVTLIAVLWIGGIIPRQIGKISAISDPFKSEMASQDIAEYRSQNENLQKRINELEQILNSTSQDNFRVADILQ